MTRSPPPARTAPGTLRRGSEPVSAGAALLGIGLTVALTLPIGTGVRIVAGDILVPVIGMGLLLAACPRWRALLPAPWVLATAGAITLVIAGGIALGAARIGDVTAWMTINRGLGWGALLLYTATGYLLVRLRPDALDRLRLFFIGACFLAAAASIVAHVGGNILWPGYAIDTGGGWRDLAERIAAPETGALFDLAAAQYFRLEGLFQNPNAFALLLGAAVLLLLTGDASNARGPWRAVACAVLLAALYLTGSRSAWVGCAIALGAAALVERLPWRVVLAAAVGAVIAVLAVTVFLDAYHASPDMFGGSQIETNERGAGTYRAPSGKVHWMSDESVSQRWRLIEHGLRLWREHPLVGGGIGVFYHQELASGVPSPAVPHNTALWLLSETGLLGLTIIAGAGAVLIVHLAGALARAEGFARRVLVSALAVIALYTGASVGMDSFYQRPLWLFVGFGVGAWHMVRIAGVPPDRGG